MATWLELKADEVRNFMLSIVARIQVHADRIDSYTETTISGTGLRIIGHATGKKVHRKQPIEGGGSLETYRGAERYIVMTGDVLPETEEVLADIDKHVDEIVAELDAKKKSNGKEKKTNAQKVHKSEDDIEDLIRNGCGDHYGGDRSRAVWYVINELLRRGYRPASIEGMLLNERNKISEHIYDQKNPRITPPSKLEKLSNRSSLIEMKKSLSIRAKITFASHCSSYVLKCATINLLVIQ